MAECNKTGNHYIGAMLPSDETGHLVNSSDIKKHSFWYWDEGLMLFDFCPYCGEDLRENKYYTKDGKELP